MIRTTLILAFSAALGTAALAQAQQQAPNMPAPQNVPAEKVDPEPIRPKDPSTTGSTDGTLSDRLERTEGVIRPPARATPDMTVPAPVPNPGTTPVIRPPGMQPSDPIQPK